MATYNLYYLPDVDPSDDVYAFPVTDSLANYSSNRIQLNEASAPDTGRFHNTVSNPSTYNYAVFYGSSQPSSWKERKDVISVVAKSDVQALTSSAKSSIASSVWGYTIEGSRTAVKALRIILATIAGRAEGSGTGQIKFYSTTNTSKARVTADVDQTGDRSNLSYDDS